MIEKLEYAMRIIAIIFIAYMLSLGIWLLVSSSKWYELRNNSQSELRNNSQSELRNNSPSDPRYTDYQTTDVIHNNTS